MSDEDYARRVGSRIRAHREKLGMSRGELAFELGAYNSGRSLIDNWESGRSAPGSRWVLKLCKALGTTPESLLK